jgi:Family of unknown function (DUF5824)
MGQFVNLIRKKLGLEPKRDKTLTGKIPNEVIVNRAAQNEAYSPDRPVVLAPARMNPPTAGHGVLVRQVMDTAKQFNAPHHIVLTRSHDTPTKKKVGAAVKNPLTPEQKLTHARRFFPGANIDVAHPDRPNLLSQASELHRQGHNHLIIVAGSDRVPEYERLLNQYNGQEGKHGYFNFKKITVVPAGAERDPKAGGLAGWSGTAARKAVESGDTETMRKVGVPPHVSDEHFNQYVQHLKTGMGLNQPVEEEAGYPVPTIPTRNARDFLGKKSPLNNLPSPGKAGDIGKDSDVDDGKDKTNFELMRRRTKKRQLSVGFLEGYDDFGIGATDSPKPDASTPTTTPVPSQSLKKKSKNLRFEGMFAADIDNGDTGESGNPNQSMEGIPTTAKETKVKKFKSVREECWTGYKKVGMKKKGNRMVPDCVPANEEADLDEATYKGKTVPLNKPMKGDVKKSKVYVDPDGDGKAKKVNFGDKNLSIKKNIPARKKSYCARSSGQGNLTDKSSANYWSRRAWNCEETNHDDDDGYTQKAGKYHRGDRVKISKDGYSGKANIDFYDPVSDTYVVSTDKQGSNLHLKSNEISPIKEEKKFSAVRHDKSGLPKKYTAGLTASEIKAKKAHINKNKKLSDRDPEAYKDMPGDKRMREKGIPQSKYTKAYHAKFGEETELDEKWSQKYKNSINCSNPKGFSQKAHCQSLKKEDLDLEEAAGLADKAKKSGISVGTLQKVYRRGVAAWNSGHRPGTTPQQWGMARVNSYISKGKTYHTADKDLHENEESLVNRIKAIMEGRK